MLPRTSATTAADGTFTADVVIPTRGSYSLDVAFAGNFLSDPAAEYVPMDAWRGRR